MLPNPYEFCSDTILGFFESWSLSGTPLSIFLVVGVSLATQSSHGYFVGEMFFATFSLNNGATVVQHLPQTGAFTVGSFVR